MRKGSILGSSIALSAMRLMTSACAFLVFWYIARISVGELGAFRTIFVFFLSADLVPLLGMNQYLIREVSIHRDEVKRYSLHGLIFSQGVSVVVILILLGVAAFGRYPPLVSQGIVAVAAGIPATAIMLCSCSVLLGLGQGVALSYIQGAETLLRTVASLVLLSMGHGVLSVIICFVAVRWLSIILHWAVLSPHAAHGKWRFDAAYFKEFLRTTPPFASILVLFLVIRFAGQFMLPWMKDTVAAGHYAIALQMLDIVMLGPTALAMSLMPVFAQKSARSVAELTAHAQKAMKIVSMVMLPVAAVFSVMAEQIVTHVFGPAYLPSVVLLRIIIWVSLLLSLDQIMSMATIARGKQLVDMMTLGVGSAVNLALLYPLISLYGEVGAALGLLFGSIALVLARLVLVRKFVMPFNPLPEVWRSYVSTACMLLAMLSGHTHGLLRTVLGIAVYAAVLVLLGGFNRSERMALSDVLHEKEGVSV